jgi:putative phage-type endonuclease
MLTDQELLERQKYIGGSDVAAILGISPWRTSWDVWAEKTGRLDMAQRKTSAAADAGNRCEPIVLDWAEERLGTSLWRNMRYEYAPWLQAQCDGIVTANGRPVEAKTAGGGALDPAWGEEGTDMVPDYYLVQTTVQMLCTGADMAHLAALLGGRGLEFRMYAIPFNAALGDAILGHCEAFWHRHVLADTPPPESGPSPEIARFVRRVPNKVVTIPAAHMAAFVVARDEAKTWQERLDNAKKTIRADLLDAEAGVSEDGNGAVTFYASDRAGYTVAPATGIRTLRYKAKGL